MQKTMLNKSKIEYISEDKKITTTWEKRTRLQLPFENFPVGGYMSNISHREGISNSEQKVLIIPKNEILNSTINTRGRR